MPSLIEAASRIADGQLSCCQLLEDCLLRIDAWEDQIQAWVRIDRDGALREARRLDELARHGQILGPLHGIPLGIKDIIDVAGLPTEAGSPLLAGCVAPADATVVRRLRAAGAVLLGKTRTTPFAFLDPTVTRNPWNRAHTPGGSSSGSAAAVAADMCLGALGTQTGGSLTRPATYCGVASLKPGFGRLPTEGVVPLSRSLDHAGVIARTVADLDMLFVACAGEHAGSPWGLNALPELFVIREYFWDQADAAVARCTDAALDRLHQAGTRLPELPLPPSFRQVHAFHRCLLAVEAAEQHFDAFSKHREAYGPQLAALIEEGLTTLAIDFSLSQRHHQLFCREMQQLLAPNRVAVTPATLTPAPAGLESTGDPAFNSPWSYAGLATVSIPCGLSPAGLPCGLQLIGLSGQERLVLEVARWCERILAFGGSPPTEILLAEG